MKYAPSRFLPLSLLFYICTSDYYTCIISCVTLSLFRSLAPSVGRENSLSDAHFSPFTLVLSIDTLLSLALQRFSLSLFLPLHARSHYLYHLTFSSSPRSVRRPSSLRWISCRASYRSIPRSALSFSCRGLSLSVSRSEHRERCSSLFFPFSLPSPAL